MGADYAAIAKFDDSSTVYNPRTKTVLLTDEQIEARLKVLAALQLYAKNLVEITNGTESPELDAASSSLGGNLATVANTFGPPVENALGISDATASTTDSASAASASSTPAPLVSTTAQNILSTGLNALGQFLVYKTVQKNLPQKIEAMDPVVEQLCKLLSDEMGVLQDGEHRTYDRIINQQTLFLRANKDKIDPDLRQLEIMKLPRLARQQSEADEKMTALQSSLRKLALTHHALAAEVQGNNPESLKQKIGDLVAIAQGLGKFYSSL